MKTFRRVTSSVLLLTFLAGAASAVGLSSATKDAAKQYLEKFITDNNIPGVLIQVTTPAGSWSEGWA